MKVINKMCSTCGRILDIVFDGDYIYGGQFIGQNGETEVWACGECKFNYDYQDT